MKLTFRLRYHTRVGQSLWMTGHHPSRGDEKKDAAPLDYLDNESWQAAFAVPPAAANEPFNYHYLLREPDGSSVEDWGRDRILVPAEFGRDELLVIDSWNNAGAAQNVFYTEPFRKVLLAGNFTEVHPPRPSEATHTFRVKAPLLPKGRTLCLLGDGLLGNWNTAKPLLLERSANENELSGAVDLRGQTFPLAYKYGVFDIEQNSFVRYEEGDNRVLNDSVAPGKHTLVADGFVRLPANTWRGAGVAIPVFSLRSEHSFGVGEFLDLKPLADWARDTGLKLIQVLPVNDTTATHTSADSYPYAAISAFALHPIYLNLAAVADAKNKNLLAALQPEGHRLNALAELDYEAVMKAKLGFLKQIFPSQKAATFRGAEYKKFFAENKHWLLPYAAFCFLRDKFGTADFKQWPGHTRYDGKKIAALAKDNDDVAFHLFLQFHLHRQLREAAAYAHANGVIVKGDIAIGVYRHSADVWQDPELYHTDIQAGAPPDAFAAKGQNWGFPTYNWPRMEADGFAWWKRRFSQMGHYFDAFRIDHILGFFRIWSIPTHAVEGILGHFVPAIPVEEDEFAARGIPYDRERFLKPFITDPVLEEIFGDESALIRREFLTAHSSGLYSLKPEFATQRQVENYFAERQPDSRSARTKLGLFDLISNVILLDVEGKLHFRLGIEHTTSYKRLAPEVRPKLLEIYVDYFFRRQDDFWKKEAMRKLPALKRVTDLLICGEDLGMVPPSVPILMKELGLLSLEVQRMPKALGREFSRPKDAPYLSVVTPSTHDMSTIRGWWEEDPAVTQKFFNQELGRPGDAPSHAAPEIVRTIVQQHLASPALWSIFQLQDLLGMDDKLRHPNVEAERINIPSDPKHYWRYRIHLSLEQLQKAKDFNSVLRELLRQSGR
ncbi:MAG TPA: 4-alpha-glucanotransferase [Verrucomicrobiae bacterium]|nr:4-alpha-glucanotransferase [Verrucomicrobiae bacterium]